MQKIGKNKKYIVIIAIFVLFCLGGGIWKADRIYRSVNNIKVDVGKKIEFRKMHQEIIDVGKKEPLIDENNAWYTRYHFIAHAGGGINGRTYTNSLEAWENSYQLGNRVFDADFTFTIDGELVLLHSWNDNLENRDSDSMHESRIYIDDNGHVQYVIRGEAVTYRKFMNQKIYYLYTPMSCEDMIKFMVEHEDLYVACDVKDDVELSYRYIVDKALELGEEDVLDRVIVNIYSYDTYDIIMDIYPFKNVTARQHKIQPNNYYELADFCLSHNIHVVNLSACYIEDEGVQLFIDKGIHVYVAVADYISDMKDYYMLGADGAVTNWLCEDDWGWVE